MGWYCICIMIRLLWYKYTISLIHPSSLAHSNTDKQEVVWGQWGDWFVVSWVKGDTSVKDVCQCACVSVCQCVSPRSRSISWVVQTHLWSRQIYRQARTGGGGGDGLLVRLTRGWHMWWCVSLVSPGEGWESSSRQGRYTCWDRDGGNS